MTIFLAPFSDGMHGISQAPHTILGIRNGQMKQHLKMAEIPVAHLNAEDTTENIHAVLRRYKEPYLVLGGNHVITLGILRARYEQSGPVHVILFDAHSDDYESAIVEKARPLHHGNWLKFAQNEGLVSGVSWYNYRGSKWKTKSLKPTTGPVHVTVDIDVLEPSEYGWASTYPELGGCSLNVLIRDIIQLPLKNCDVTADFVEYNPERDTPNKIGGQAASHIVTTLLDIIGA